MSMIGNYLRLPEADLSRFIADPEAIMGFLYPDDDSAFPSNRHLDIDKTWQIIHFLLTGSAWEGEAPLRNAVLGGSVIGDIDVGYGPARYLRPPEVSEVALALSAISPVMLWSRFDLKAARDNEIYPTGWEGNDTERDYAMDYFQQLKTFFDEANKQNEAIILYLN